MSDLRILITGNSLMAGALVRTAPGHHLTCTYCTTPIRPLGARLVYLDITDETSVRQVFDDVSPHIVIHTAAIGSVDYAEKHPRACREVNVEGTRRIISACRRHGAHLVFISSNAIFDGRNAPYAEDDPPAPINYYGQLKVEAERLVAGADPSWTIIRPILMYGWHSPGHRSNPVTWLLDALRKGERVKMVTDIYCNPLWADNGAEAVWAAVVRRLPGIFHIAGKNRLSRFSFARETARVFDLDPGLIEPVKNAYFTGIAPRPADTSYCTGKMQQVLGVRPLTTREGLNRMWLQELSRESWWQKMPSVPEEGLYEDITGRTPQLAGAVD